MDAEVISLTRDALWLMLALSLPPILVATILGLLVSLLQAVTQIQEQTLAFLVKLVAICVTFAIMAALTGETLMQFSYRVFDKIG